MRHLIFSGKIWAGAHNFNKISIVLQTRKF